MRKRSIHFVLAWRLALVAFIIASVLAVLVVVNSRHDIGEIVLGHVLQSASDFSLMARPYLDVDGTLDRAGVQRTLRDFAEHGVRLRYGRAVYAAVHDNAGGELARLTRSEYERIEAVTDYLAGLDDETSAPAAGYEIVRLADRPHVRIVAPLTSSAGDTVAHANVVFAVSNEVMADVQRGVIETILIALAIVLATTGLLYPVIVSLLRKQSRLAVSLLDSNLETLQVLGGAVAKRDSDTDIHNYRVTIYAVRLAEAMGLAQERIRALIKGAFLHDVGKVGIADNILLKPGRLTDEEFSVMKTHVQHGLDIVGRSAWLDDAKDVVGYHHEKMDGSGYLRGLVGDDIPLAARIFAIADVFDALTSQRPYKQPFSFDDAMGVLQEGRDTHFDGVLLDTFRGIARPLYDEFAGHDDDGARAELRRIIDSYFAADANSLIPD